MKQIAKNIFWGIFTLIERIFWRGFSGIMLAALAVIIAETLGANSHYQAISGIIVGVSYIILYVADKGIQKDILVFKIRADLVDGTLHFDSEVPDITIPNAISPMATNALAQGDLYEYARCRANNL